MTPSPFLLLFPWGQATFHGSRRILELGCYLNNMTMYAGECYRRGRGGSVQRDLLACVCQLGLPMWFCSLSSADLHWQNLPASIFKQEGRTSTIEGLDWAAKCELLCHNPVMAACMSDCRWHCFLNKVFKSPAEPIDISF